MDNRLDWWIHSFMVWALWTLLEHTYLYFVGQWLNSFKDIFSLDSE